jgi:hypothetical protein
MARARAKTKSATQRTSKKRAKPAAKDNAPKYEIGDIVLEDTSAEAKSLDGTWHPCNGAELDAAEYPTLAKKLHGELHADGTLNLPLLVGQRIRIK